MIEIQRDGKFRVRLSHDERIEVTNIDTRELAEQIDKALHEAYHRGTLSPTMRPPRRRGDDDG
jgi:hypothetical protein